MGVALGIVLKFIFENFVYTFGGKYYLQKKGAPTGNRISMCGATLTMQEWRDEFKQILINSKIDELLAGLYVDDGRNLIEVLPLGVRFSETDKIFKYSEEWAKDDVIRGHSSKMRTKIEVQKAMNSISPDLHFTIEVTDDFADNKLPTLSFSIWEEIWGLSHSYFEKDVRSQILLMERSAMSNNSKYSIMTNELRRRFEVMHDRVDFKEKITIVNKYTQQLLNSGYSRAQIREILLSAIRGYERKEKERKRSNRQKFRHGKDTLKNRITKKLTESTTWF